MHQSPSVEVWCGGWGEHGAHGVSLQILLTASTGVRQILCSNPGSDTYRCVVLGCLMLPSIK